MCHSYFGSVYEISSSALLGCALRVVPYLKGHPSRGMHLQADSRLCLIAYCNSDLLLDTSSLWVALLFLGRPGNSILFRALPPKPSIVPWRSLCMSLSGLVSFFVIFRFPFHSLFRYTATVKLSSILLLILYFMSGRNILRLTIILSVMLSCLVLFFPDIFEVTAAYRYFH